MSEYPLSYNTFQSQATRQVFRYALNQGHLGPLVFLWALGTAFTALFVSQNSWLILLLWTTLVLALAYGMMRSYLGSRQVRQRLLQSALERRCLGRESWDADLWQSVPIRNGTDILLKAALEVDEMEQEHGPDIDLRSAFEDAGRMMWLQYSLAKNAKELERNLQLAISGYPTAPYSPGADSEVTVAVESVQRNLEAVEELTAQAHSRVDEVSEQLEVFLPTLLELKEREPHSYPVAAAELAQETADVLARIRARVV